MADGLDFLRNPNILGRLSTNESLSPETRAKIQQVAANSPVPAPVVQEPVVEQSVPLDQTEVAYAPNTSASRPLQPQTVAPQLGGYNKVTAAGEKALEMGMKAAKEENDLANGYMIENAKFVKEQDEIIKNQAELAERRMLDAQDRLEKITNQEIDPNRVFKDMSTGQKIGTVLLAAIAGSQGAATLNRMVDQDIKAQTDFKNSGIDAAKNAQSTYKDILSQYKDSIASKALLKATQLQAVQVKMNALASQSKNADVQMKLAALYNDVEANKQKALSDFNERMGKVGATQQMDPTGQLISKLPPGLQGKAFEEKGKLETFNQGIGEIRTLMSRMKELQSIKSRAGSPFQSSSLIEKARADIFPIVKAIVGERMTDGDAKLLIDSQLVGFFDNNNTTGIKTGDLERKLFQTISSQMPILKSLGISPQYTDTNKLINKERVK